MEAIAVEISDYELERGKPMPSKNHGFVQMKLGLELMSRYEDRFWFASEVNIEVGGRVLVPDVVIYGNITTDMSHDEIVMSELPLTTIEILSPRQALDDLIDKAMAYLEAGVKSCWIVSPKSMGLFLYSPEGHRYFQSPETVTDPATGIELPLAPLFRRGRA